ncbi:redoxin domain-containing protein [bacterium]|nr:redoxin domain-containing protein [bacterium]
MNQRPKRRPLYFLIFGLLVIAGLFWFRPRFQHIVTLNAALAAPSVDTGLVSDLISHDPAPLQVIERFYDTGKIPHRLAALRALSSSDLVSHLKPMPAWLREAALCPDFQVRELTLGLVRYLDKEEATPLVRAGLLDVDPDLKFVAIRAAVAGGMTNLITDVAALLNNDSLNIQIAAATALREWTGQDYGVRRATLGGDYNDWNSEQTSVDPDKLAKVNHGLDEWRTWLQEHASNWTDLKPGPAAKSDEPLRPAPDFALQDLTGKTVHLSELRGRPVFVNFWATWCTACWAELPHLVKLHKEYGDKLAIVGIALDGLPDQHEIDHGHSDGDHEDGDDQPTKANASTPHSELVALVGGYAKKKGLTYPILLDPEGQSSLVYQGNELPVNVLIDANGNLHRRFIGPRSPEAFDAMIREVTAKR